MEDFLISVVYQTGIILLPLEIFIFHELQLKILWNVCDLFYFSQCQAACRASTDVINPTGQEILQPFQESKLLSDHDPTMSSGNGIIFNQTACHLRAEAGPCPQRLPRFYHHNGFCFQFLYGGCGGNQNNFFSELECMMKCTSSHAEDMIANPILRTQPSTPTNICLLPLSMGSCAQNQTRFYFNPSIDDCEPFQFGGCGGNENNFAKISKCRKICRPWIWNSCCWCGTFSIILVQNQNDKWHELYGFHQEFFQMIVKRCTAMVTLAKF